MPEGTVVFNVGGRCFEVLRHIIDSRPSTMLASLLDDIGLVDDTHPIFVDANPDRFAHMLDWYRYGQMYVDGGPASITAVLRDSRFFLLPDVVTINGTKHAVRAPGCHDSDVPTARKVRDTTKDAILTSWPTFDDCVSRIINELEAHLLDLRCDYDLDYAAPTSLFKDYPILQLCEGFPAWSQSTPHHQRCLGMLVHDLRRRGFECGLCNTGCWPSLRVGVRLEDHAQTKTNAMAMPMRVVLDGVGVDRGMLCVNKMEGI